MKMRRGNAAPGFARCGALSLPLTRVNGNDNSPRQRGSRLRSLRRGAPRNRRNGKITLTNRGYLSVNFAWGSRMSNTRPSHSSAGLYEIGPEEQVLLTEFMAVAEGRLDPILDDFYTRIMRSEEHTSALQSLM